MWSLLKQEQKPDGWPEDLWASFLQWRSSEPMVDDEDTAEPDAESDPEGDGDVSLVDHIADAARHLHVDREVLD